MIWFALLQPIMPIGNGAIPLAKPCVCVCVFVRLASYHFVSEQPQGASIFYKHLETRQ